MKKVVITGRGVVSPLGNGIAANCEALRAGRSGIIFSQEWRDLGMDSQVYGKADEDIACPLLDRKRKRFTSPNSIMAVAAVYEAITEAGLSLEDLRRYRVAVIGGCAGSNYIEVHHGAANFHLHHKVRKVSPFTVPRVMPSSAVANISLIFGITGESYDISSACSSGAHAIMLGSRLLQAGLYDIVLAGGSEEVSWVQALGFDAMRALSSGYNDTPECASRPFDADRDGFVIAEGAGYVVLENEDFARNRGVRPICVLSGSAANSNARDMVVPDAASSAEVMRMALAQAGIEPEEVVYVNSHGTATPTGDPTEAAALQRVFPHGPAVNSTKSMTGHMIGAAGAVELIFTSIMMENRFICPSLNLKTVPEEFAGIDFVTATRENVDIPHALSNSFGFGGQNACLVLSGCDGQL
ncbi:MAG: beta-ketoacyl-[acyl-carrier-protein] synthase family protein [Victivallales bacterium]|nr:beta-ketoacyl-[acyl-carrier-protein] synthase family protein [Victivallales bacterium]